MSKYSIPSQGRLQGGGEEVDQIVLRGKRITLWRGKNSPRYMGNM